MGKWIEKQDLKNETKEKNRIRREKIAGYFLNLSQLTFVALVLGGITPLYIDEAFGSRLIEMSKCRVVELRGRELNYRMYG